MGRYGWLAGGEDGLQTVNRDPRLRAHAHLLPTTRSVPRLGWLAEGEDGLQAVDGVAHVRAGGGESRQSTFHATGQSHMNSLACLWFTTCATFHHQQARSGNQEVRAPVFFAFRMPGSSLCPRRRVSGHDVPCRFQRPVPCLKTAFFAKCDCPAVPNKILDESRVLVSDKTREMPRGHLFQGDKHNRRGEICEKPETLQTETESRTGCRQTLNVMTGSFRRFLHIFSRVQQRKEGNI